MDSLNELINTFKKFPGIGSKGASRIAFYLLQQEQKELYNIGKLIATFKKELKTCVHCGNISDKNPCYICSDPLRDRKTLCIVEDLESLTAFEQAHIYNGLYHVLGERVSPLDGEDISEKSRNFLLKHIKELKPNEIIIATSPKAEGDLTSYMLLELLSGLNVKKISRLAYGLPVGGSIVFADSLTLHTALDSRREIQ